MTTLVISDLHLSPERPALTRAFCRFLVAEAAGADALYILGDLVDAWVGDDDPSEFARDVKRALHLLAHRGTSIFFLHGNRDFLVGPHFAAQVGATLLPQEYVANIYGQRVLLMHGDSLCTDDHDYQRFRRWVRNPLGLWLLRHLPLRQRQNIAASWRARSQAANAGKTAAIMDVTQEAVTDALHRHGVSLLVHGHTHRPAVHCVEINGEQSTRVVLGDWDEQLGWYVRFDADTPRQIPDLISFSL